MNTDKVLALAREAGIGWGEGEGLGGMPEFLTTFAALIQREMEAENAELRKGIHAVAELIESSHGVTGLHLNGDVAPWDELLTGGRFEAWLIDFDTAINSARNK